SDGLTFDVPAVAERPAEMLPYRRVVDDADTGNFRPRLGARGERPDCRPSDQHDELPPSHLITSSARFILARNIRLTRPIYCVTSSTILNGVSAARRTLAKPPDLMTSVNLASPACAPSA